MTVIIPVWHNVAYNDVRDYSPLLAERVAVTTGKGLEQVASAIVASAKLR